MWVTENRNTSTMRWFLIFISLDGAIYYLVNLYLLFVEFSKSEYFECD